MLQQWDYFERFSNGFPDESGLDGKTALVTGAARGLGEAFALALADAGASVAVLDLPASAAAGAEVVRRIRVAGRRAGFYPFDITETAQIPELIARVARDLGGLNILVNNAGTLDAVDALGCTSELWDTVLAVNLKAMFFFAQAAATHMIAHGRGKIVNVGSPLGLIAGGSAPAYRSSKGGVHSLTRELAFEWIKHGIHLNAIAPGPTATPLMRGFDEASGKTEEEIAEDVRRRVPLGRRMHYDEIAAPLVFLASPASDGLVGHLLVADGGQTIF